AEEEKEDTVYLPQAVIDSAFGWKYGKVQELEISTIIKAIDDAFTKSKYNYSVSVDAGDGWVVEITAISSFNLYYKGKEVGGGGLAWIDPSAPGTDWQKTIAYLKSGEPRFLKYTDKDGHNCFVVKMSNTHLNIFYAGVPGYGIIMIMDDNSPFTIGDIGFLPSDEGKNGKFLTILVKIKDDQIVGIAVSNRDKWFSEEMRFTAMK
ncbi:MAG: hypothetical protein ACP5KP_02170, partial [Candidatus Micrarchaeia archaeon]